ncbi:acyl-CoA reductase [Actinosynnema sp. NPDC047251]|uniref:Acyl protein synthase/acyl-CoA reductase-like protein n=1 Tax=Saccharothrix espanaensis (strain ATCC 51144 / DSM 44229 / JCM 9112 / NBRC 15066 / NRRL 15764) TaxID=1179773 RepID=K0K4G4_SACES|nr:ACP synthase [Saccharothrix espanaensis]CCH31438.1 Acyl protein synthase/acyl-CoA reductase-like protein [Saccharothrix espanaensis DSM 44229]
MTVAHDDPHVTGLFERMAALVTDQAGDPAAIHEELTELAVANAPDVARYWKQVGTGVGVPDTAYKDGGPHLFPDEPPVRVFRTSGTTGSVRGVVRYSRLGLVLKGLAVKANARRHLLVDGVRPVVVRFAPTERAAPDMAIAFDMARIQEECGDPELSTAVIGASGVDYPLLARTLDAAVATGRPVVLIGATFAFVNICDRLEAEGRRWELPAGSRMYDGGGFKGRSRVVPVDELRATVRRVFGVGGFGNIFGMTELANQHFDGADVPVGPLGERPKESRPVAGPRVRDPRTREYLAHGPGLLEITDLSLLDRPHVLLTGDVGIATAHGVAIAGRIAGSTSRGCSLSLDEMTGGR